MYQSSTGRLQMRRDKCCRAWPVLVCAKLTVERQEPNRKMRLKQHEPIAGWNKWTMRLIDWTFYIQPDWMKAKVPSRGKRRSRYCRTHISSEGKKSFSQHTGCKFWARWSRGEDVCFLRLLNSKKNSFKLFFKVAVTRNYLNRNRTTSSCTSLCSLPTTLMLKPWVVFHSEQTVGLSAKKEKWTKRTKTNERTERIHSWMN